MSASKMAPISGKYKQAANIASMDVLVQHCAILEPAASHWFLDVWCRSGKQEWDRLRDACPEAKVVVKSNDILVSLPPLPEELELTVFGKPGECDMKRMQLCIFGRKPVIGKDWVISVYLCDDTVMAFENVHKREEKKGNKLLTTRAGLFVANSDEDIKISVNTLETGWQIKGSGTKTIKSRTAWNSPENATDFPCLKFEVCHVDEMKQSFFCGITASHGTDIAEAEIRAFFKQENEKADSLNISDDLFKGCQELQANDNRTGYPKKNHRSLPGTILWFNVIVVLICFMVISKDFKPAEEMKDVCPREEMKLIFPHLEPAIKSGDYAELYIWTVSDSVKKTEKKCNIKRKQNKHPLVHQMNVSSSVNCTQVEEMKDVCPREEMKLIFPHLEPAIKSGDYEELIWTVSDSVKKTEKKCNIKRKQNKPPLVHQMNVSSSVSCTQVEEMKDVCPREEMKLIFPHLEPAIKSRDYEVLLWTVFDPVMKTEKKPLVHCDENLKCGIFTLGIFGGRIKIRSTEQGMLVVKQLIKDDLLTFACYILRKQNKPPLVYQMNVFSSVNCLSTVVGQDVNLNQALTFGCYIERKQNKPPLVYQMNVSSSVNCTQAEEMKDVYTMEEINSMFFHLEPVIKSGDYEKLIWTVSDSVTETEYKFNLTGNQNKPPLVYQMNVSSSVNCLSTVAGQDVNLNQALGEIPSRETIEDMCWYWIKPDGEKQKIVYCDPTTCLFEDCSSSCLCWPRLKIDGLINVGEVNRGLKLECRIYPKIIGRTATQTMPQVYALKIKDVFSSDVGHVSATFTCPGNGTIHGWLKKYPCTYVPGTEEGNIIGSAEGGSKFCNDTMSCQWKGNTVFF